MNQYWNSNPINQFVGNATVFALSNWNGSNGFSEIAQINNFPIKINRVYIIFGASEHIKCATTSQKVIALWILFFFFCLLASNMRFLFCVYKKWNRAKIYERHFKCLRLWSVKCFDNEHMQCQSACFSC